MAQAFQTHTLDMARKYGRDVSEWEGLKVRLLDGEYPIFPGVQLGFHRIQDFWVREQRGEKSTGYRAIVGGCSAGFRQDFGILASGEVTTCCVDYDGKNVIGDLRTQSIMEVINSAEAKRIKRSLERFIPPKPFCRECLGGPTLGASVMKQVSTIAVDLRDRVRPRKNYSALRDRLSGAESGRSL
jgi:hypothetical protein